MLRFGATATMCVGLAVAASACSLAGGVAAEAEEASARAGWQRCGHVPSGTYYFAGRVSVAQIGCRRGRKVARKAARELSAVGVGYPYSFGFVALRHTWNCWFEEGVASDSKFRVRCAELDGGRARVHFTSRPSE